MLIVYVPKEFTYRLSLSVPFTDHCPCRVKPVVNHLRILKCAEGNTVSDMEPKILIHLGKGSYSNKEIVPVYSSIFQYVPGWIELNFQDISDVVYHTSVAINMLSCIYFATFGGGGTFS